MIVCQNACLLTIEFLFTLLGGKDWQLPGQA